MPTWGIAAGIGIVLTVLLGLAVNEIRTQDKEMGRMEMAKALQDQAVKNKEAISKAVAEVQSKYQTKVSSLEANLNEANNKLLRNAINAEYDAKETPLAFGDEFVRDLILLDCLWSLGEREGDNSARTACVREAELADTAHSGVPVSVVTPDFRDLWYYACQDWSGIGTSTGTINYTVEDWKAEYGSFDSKLCYQTTVMFTPEFSYYLRDFLNKREGYTAKLANFSLANRSLLDAVVQTTKDSKTSKN